MLLHQVDIAPEAIGIIVGNAVVPNLVEAAHNAEQMAPGRLFAGIPELAPFLFAVGGGMEIGVAGMEILRRLHTLSVMNALRKRQMCFHLP